MNNVYFNQVTGSVPLCDFTHENDANSSDSSLVFLSAKPIYTPNQDSNNSAPHDSRQIVVMAEPSRTLRNSSDCNQTINSPTEINATSTSICNDVPGGNAVNKTEVQCPLMHVNVQPVNGIKNIKTTHDGDKNDANEMGDSFDGANAIADVATLPLSTPVWFVPATIHDIRFDLMVDTGSATSLIDFKLFSKYFPEKEYTANKCLPKLKAANGSDMTIYGQAQLTARLGTRNFRLEVVLTDLNCDGILGINFLKTHGLQIDVGEGTLSKKNWVLSLHDKTVLSGEGPKYYGAFRVKKPLTSK